jgi:hypothetical protein
MLTAVFSLMSWSLLGNLAHPISLEYEIKAAYIYKFVKFVDWPATVLADSPDTFCIGVFGDGDLNAAVESIVGKDVRGHKIEIRRFKSVAEIAPCHILFVSASARSRVAEIQNRLAGTPTLTIGEFDGFGQKGGMINFYLDEGRVLFEVNVEAAEASGLRISSKMLKLARIVKTGNAGDRE